MKTSFKIPFAPVVAIAFGIVATVLVLMTPQWLFESGVIASGLPSLLAAAKPPLGSTARTLAAVFAGLAVALPLWAVLATLRKAVKRAVPAKARGSRIDAVPAKVQNPIGQREPIFAQRDLGAPFMSHEAIAAQSLNAVAAANPVVETSAIEDAVVVDAPPPFIAPESAPAPVVAKPVVAEPVAAVPPPAPVAPIENDDSIAGLMTRLDAAIARQSHNSTARPLAIGDIASLRKALGALA